MDFLLSNDFWVGLQASLASVAISVAGIWFISTRRRHPRANLEQKIWHWVLDAQDRSEVLLRVVVIVENKGEVLLRLKLARVFVRQISPLSSDIVAQLPHLRDLPVNKKQKAFLLNLNPFYCQELEWKRNECRELEPGEIDEFDFHFLIPANVKCVLVYSFLENLHNSRVPIDWRHLWQYLNSPEKRKRYFGWNTSSVYNIQAQQDEAMVASHKHLPSD